MPLRAHWNSKMYSTSSMSAATTKGSSLSVNVPDCILARSRMSSVRLSIIVVDTLPILKCFWLVSMFFVSSLFAGFIGVGINEGFDDLLVVGLEHEQRVRKRVQWRAELVRHARKHQVQQLVDGALLLVLLGVGDVHEHVHEAALERIVVDVLALKLVKPRVFVFAVCVGVSAGVERPGLDDAHHLVAVIGQRLLVLVEQAAEHHLAQLVALALEVLDLFVQFDVLDNEVEFFIEKWFANRLFVLDKYCRSRVVEKADNEVLGICVEALDKN
mmetsp:Transcript_15290/g.17739  ORF Transcript_15290/g.17739 Transcript_15290/m.17739 type:complete len:272 (+) Transcript_15290:161-976(+)